MIVMNKFSISLMSGKWTVKPSFSLKIHLLIEDISKTLTYALVILTYYVPNKYKKPSMFSSSTTDIIPSSL